MQKEQVKNIVTPSILFMAGNRRALFSASDWLVSIVFVWLNSQRLLEKNLSDFLVLVIRWEIAWACAHGGVSALTCSPRLMLDIVSYRSSVNTPASSSRIPLVACALQSSGFALCFLVHQHLPAAFWVQHGVALPDSWSGKIEVFPR